MKRMTDAGRGARGMRSSQQILSMNPSLRRLAIAGIHIESSTFSPMRTRAEDFAATRGREMLERYPFLEEGEFREIEAVPLAHFRAIPGGQVTAAGYAAMKAEILARLDEVLPVDGFYFDVHGAMAVEGLEDAEADLLQSIRQRLGPAVPVTCSQDLHGNVSADLVAGVDLITTYRTAPHVDWMETRRRAVAMLLRWWRDPQPVYRARVGIPVLVSGEMSSTESEPGRSLYAELANDSARAGVWEAALWVGYAWADQARARACVVVTGTGQNAVAELAEEIAARYWRAREDFQFMSPAGSARGCLDQALAAGGDGHFLSDAGDNPTAGAAGDVPGTLAALLEHEAFSGGNPRATAIFASIPDAAAMEQVAGLAVGDEVTVELGGKLDPVHGEPLVFHGTLVKMVAGDAVGGRQAVLGRGGVRVIITERRKPFHHRADFLALELDPREFTVTVVKIGYLEPQLKAMATSHHLVLSAGAVPPDLTKIHYQHLSRPMFPLDRNFEWEPRAERFKSFG